MKIHCGISGCPGHAMDDHRGCDGPMPKQARSAPTREDVLTETIRLVRQHPDFDEGGFMADAMDQALRGETPKVLIDLSYIAQGRKPPNPLLTIDMLLFCPRCQKQHIDAADTKKKYKNGCHDSWGGESGGENPAGWTTPPHATHTCRYCGLLWRPSNANTNGVE